MREVQEVVSLQSSPCIFYKIAMAILGGYRLFDRLIPLVFALVATTLAWADSQYIYDATGRLIEVIASDGSAAQYQYDSAGNVTAIARANASTLTIATFSPAVGSPGASVTISGTGFIAAIGQNNVAFNGVAATVTSAAANRLIVTIPVSATSGPISISNTNGSVASSSNFTVVPALAISSFTPSTGASSAVVTINGTGFDPVAGNNIVDFNGTTAAVSSASSTQLQTSVPANATSGRISVRNLSGSAQGASDFIVPPGTYLPSDVGATTRISAGGTGQAISVSTANKVGVVVFDGIQGQGATLVLTNVTMGGTLTIYGPDGALLKTATIANNGIVTLPPLTRTGAYTILLAPGTSTGVATLKLNADVQGALSLGVAFPTALTGGQSARYVFSGQAGQRYNLVLANLVTAPANSAINVQIYKPDGSAFTSTAWCSASVTATTGNCDISDLPVSGLYTAILSAPLATTSASFNVWLNPVVDGGAVNINGSPIAFTPLPGQDVHYGLSGTAGQYLSVAYTNHGLARGSVYVLNPDGSTLGSKTFTSATTTDVLRLPVLASTGGYALWFFADGDSVGSVDALLSTDMTGSPAMNSNTHVNLARIGQDGRFTFSGQSGQAYSIALANLVTSSAGSAVTIKILKPDGSIFSNAANCVAFTSSSGTCDVSALPSTGTYTVLLDAGTATAEFDLWITQNSDGGVYALNGAAKTFTTMFPAQDSHYTFSGTAGQHLSLMFTNSSVASGSIFVTKPDGSTLIWTPYSSVAASGVLDLPSLPSTGSYTVWVYLDGTSTGTITTQLSSLATGSFAVNGATQVSLGQNGTFTFSGQAGQTYSLSLAGLVSTPGGGSISIQIKNPDGSTFANSAWCGTFNSTSGNCDLSVLSTSGTYSFTLSKTSVSYISFTAWLSQASSGGGLAVDTPAAYSTAVPGQDARYTYSGTSGQNLSLAFSGNTFASGSIYVVKPDGSVLASRTYTSSTPSGTLTLPTLPTTGTYVVWVYVDGTSAGAMNIQLNNR